MYEKDNKINSPSFYRSNNDIGLIYIVENQDIYKALDYIKKGGLNEYPIGLNSYGLYWQFYLKNISNAKYFFEEASKKYHLPLAEYNYGYLCEKKNKVDESINYYIKASENEGIQICYRGQVIDDQMFQDSQDFIAYFVNFKLALYFLTTNDFENAKKYFIKAIFNKFFIDSSNEYSNIFSSLKKFLLVIFSKIEKSSIVDKKQKISPIDDSTDFIDENKQYLNDKQCSIENIINENYLIDLILNDSNCKIQLIKEIQRIVDDVNNILYSPPYSVLFGRINYHMKHKLKDLQTKKNITKPFYDGFGLEDA